MTKHTNGQLSKRSRNLRENSFSWRGTYLTKYPAGFVLFDSGPPCTCWDIVLIVSEVAWPPGTKKLKMSVSRKNTRCRVPFSLYLWDSSRQMFRRMKLRIFDATPKRTPGLSTNFSRQTRNFMCPALHFLSFANKLTLLSSRGPVCEVFLTNVNLSGKDKKIRAGHLKFLVRLKKLLETHGVRGGVSSKMRDFIRRNICLDESQS